MTEPKNNRDRVPPGREMVAFLAVFALGALSRQLYSDGHIWWARTILLAFVLWVSFRKREVSR